MSSSVRQSGESDLFSIEPISSSHVEQAIQRQSILTKPAGSLGRLEDIACQIAGIQRSDTPSIAEKWVVVAAADHGVVEEGISAYPQAVTAQMVANFLVGGAAINALAAQSSAKVKVVDAGVANDIPGDTTNLTVAKLANGTDNFVYGPAMSHSQAGEILRRGYELALELADQGADLVALGEMGIGNTTAASAITSVMLGESPKKVTGHGTGIDEVTRLKKAYVVSQAIKVNSPDPSKPVDVLAKIGGFEIGYLAGMMLGAAKSRTLVVLDGFISTSAALIAAAINPTVTQYMLASHQSVEPGHILAIEHLGLQPAFDLNMRLGEASGAALSIPIIESAVRVHNEMATFEQAAVSESIAVDESIEGKSENEPESVSS